MFSIPDKCHLTTDYDELVDALSSCENLIQFLGGEKEIQYLAKQAKSPPSPPTHRAYQRWFIVWLKVESTALVCFHRLLHASKQYWIPYFPDLTALQVKIKHRYFQNQQHTIQAVFKNALLIPSINAHKPENSDFYLHPDVNLKMRIFDNGQYQVGHSARKSFFMQNGLCDGMCTWFTYLYFKTLPYYIDREAQLQAIAKLFENGAPKQAELLQLIKI